MPLPKYHQVYLVLREQLGEGKFANGLPGELRLMSEFGVARVTVRRALQQLAQEGLISREPGRGTRALQLPGKPRVQGAEAVQQQARLSGLLENLVTMGLRTSVRVLSLESVQANEALAQVLQLEVGDYLQKAQRVRSTQEGPLSHITTWVPHKIANAFAQDQLSQKPILLLLEQAGVHVGRAEQSISAKLADAQLAQHLEVSVGSALLEVRRLIYNDCDQPVLWLHGFYRPDRYEYQMQLSRVGDINAKVWVSKELSASFH
jgi:GntR family transcriptional regulator